MERVGVVSELWRFPVKSMAGEPLERAEVRELGLVGDRLWAVRDEERGHITGGKRIPALMGCTARFLAEPAADAVGDRVPPVVITLPDGGEITSDAADAGARLSELLGRRVSLCPRQPAEDRAHYRAPRPTASDMRQQFGVGPDDPMPDFSMFSSAMLIELARYATPPGSYFDAYPLHLLTTASLAELARRAPAADIAPRRFRPNLLVDSSETGMAEAAWCGGTVRVGTVTAAVEIPTVRCSMTTRAQPGVGEDPAVLRALVEHARRCAGVYARVEASGVVSVGDSIELERPRTGVVGGWMQSGARSLRRLALRATAAVLPEK